MGGRDLLREVSIENQLFDHPLLFIGKLIAIPAKDLDTVVLIRVVGSGNNDSGIGTHAFGNECNPWSGKNTHEIRVTTHGRDAGQ
jgi:hypothetical protein